MAGSGGVDVLLGGDTMLCPLAKAGLPKLISKSAEILDNEKAEIDAVVRNCDGKMCGWWDGVGEQCSMITIAIELRNIRREHGVR